MMLTIFDYYSHQQFFSGYPGGHSWEEEHNIHDEPYGYELGDDVSNHLYSTITNILFSDYSHLKSKANLTTHT